MGVSEALSELSIRLVRLQGDAGLSDAELWVARMMSQVFRMALGFVAGLPPSRRNLPEFWEAKPDLFVTQAAKSGRDIVGPTATPEDTALLAANGRLFTEEVLLRLPPGALEPAAPGGVTGRQAWAKPLATPMTPVAPEVPPDDPLTARYLLTERMARRLFTDLPGLDPDVLAVALQCMARLTRAERPSPGEQKGTPQTPGSGARPHGASPSFPRRAAGDDPEDTPEAMLFDLRQPEIGFDDVILPEETLGEIRTALVQIRKHPLLVERWGVGERYRMGRGLAFNFAGPVGTGKTLSAEAVAHELGRPLMTVKYSGVESKWIGETGKHIAAVFEAARREQAVLFFDEADAIASRRTANIEGSGRHYNQTVNILLHELEQYEGVVIFATNLAANFDPAFERRIQSHILFRMPSATERERIWRAHLPPRAPLAPDVDLRCLAEAFEIAGGDIRNAVLKAVRLAALEEAPEEALSIAQEHLLAGARAVLDARQVMAQSILRSSES